MVRRVCAIKNVLDIMPMETDTIEFNANADGDWFFHCHILYHMMAGMNRVFSYENSANPLIPNKELAYKKIAKGGNGLHFMAEMILLLMGMMVRLWCKMQDGVLYRMAFGIQ
jgi:hypothetical protein